MAKLTVIKRVSGLKLTKLTVLIDKTVHDCAYLTVFNTESDTVLHISNETACLSLNRVLVNKPAVNGSLGHVRVVSFVN